MRRLLSVTGDGFGYAAEAAAPLELDLEPGGDGVIALLQNDVNNAVALDLGENTFSFYEETYTGADALYVNTSGTLTLGGFSYDFYNSDLTSSPYQATIAPLWGQWATDFNAEDQVLARFDSTDADPEPERLVIEWNVVQNYDNHFWGGTGESPITFQAVLELNTGEAPGQIIFNYPDVDTGDYLSNGGTATVGIKNAGYQGANRLLVAYYPLYYGGGELIGSGQAVRIFWAGDDAPTADAGPIGAGTYSVPAGYQVQLDASNSSDPQQSNYTLIYEWDLDGDGTFGELAWDGGMNGTEQGMAPIFEAYGLSAGQSHTVTLRVIDGGGLVATDTAVIAVTENQDPTAEAGPPWWYGSDSYTVVEGQWVQVDGSFSFDPEGWITEFAWDFDGDDVLGEYEWAGGDNGSEVGTWTYFIANGLSAGDSRTITLRVTDRGGATATDTAVVNVIANQPPVADAGPPGGGSYTMSVGQFFTLNGSASYDPDDTLFWENFQWDLDGDGVFGEAWWNGGSPDNGEEIGPFPAFFSAGLAAGQTVTVTLRVTDGVGHISEDTATISIVPNRPPVVDAGPPWWYGTSEYPSYGESGVMLDASATFDPDGDFLDWLNFQWDLDGDGEYGEFSWDGGERGDEVGQFTFFNAFGLDSSSLHTVRLRVTDPFGNTGEDSAIVRVLGSEPMAVIRGAPADGLEGVAITMESSLFEQFPSANPTYQWTASKEGTPGVFATGTLPTFSFVPDDQGTYRVTLTVTDDDGEVSPLTPENDLTIAVGNVAPRLSALSLDSSTIDEGGTVTLTGSYNDLGSLDSHMLTIDWGDGTIETVELGVVGSNLPLTAAREFGGHTYYAIQAELLTWEQAEAEARRLGGHLVAIGDAAENLIVTEFARSAYGEQPVWIGLNDAADEGTFEWSSDEPVSYTNWAPGEPNDFLPLGGEEYTELMAYSRNGDGGMWNDLPVGGALGRPIRGAIIELDHAPATIAPTFTVSHQYLDDRPSGTASDQYQVRVTLTESSGAVAKDALGLVHWAESDGGNGHYYQLTSSAMSFEEAEVEAMALGGHLVSITSQEEQDFLTAEFASGIGQNRRFWLGLTDRDIEGQFTWTSGEVLGYQNWNPGEPNNCCAGQDFGVFNYRANAGMPIGLWDDDAGPSVSNIRYYGIIELDSPPTPGLSVTVNNVAPAIDDVSSSASQVGSAAAGSLVNVAALFGDAGTLDAHSATIDWGDGTSSPASVNTGTASGSHAYAQGGIYTATLTVSDDDGGSASRDVLVYVSGVGIHNGVLQIVGTAGNDVVSVSTQQQGTPEARLSVSANYLSGGPLVFAAPSVQRIDVFLGAGNDVASVASSVNVSALLDGGDGNDVLTAGGGPAILFGSVGDDVLTGGASRDILIGGLGADRLVGGDGDDILVGGHTSHDNDPAALAAIAAEWRRTDRTYAQRVAALQDGGGVNGPSLFNSTTVFDDRASDLLNSGAVDILTGGAGDDWFLVDVAGAGKFDTVAAVQSGEQRTDVN